MAELLVEPAAQTLCQSLLAAINDQLKYVCSYRKYIKDLNDGLTHLEDKRKRVQEDVDVATYDGQKIHDDVTRWLDDARKITEQAKKVIENHKNSKKGCFRGVIPNPSTRFRIARQAEGNKQEINKLQQRNHFPTVSRQQLPPGIVMGDYKGPEYWIAPSRELLLQDINKALLDAKVRVVGIFGASGVGKSTLLKQLEKQVQERKLNYDFDAVTMATVSRFPNWEKVQNDLGYRLGLKMEEKSLDQKVDRLWNRLSQKGKVLVILDDIWDKIDLVKLGVPLDDNHANIKLLLTSRSERVLTDKMNSERNFHLNPLEEWEAVNLFENIVGDRAWDEAKLIDQLAKECKGLPVLISPLAASLKTLPQSTWFEALNKLRETSKLETENFIEESMKFNYHLVGSEEARSLFLLCGQTGLHAIAINYLLELGMGLGLLKGVHTMEEAREKVKLLLDNLKASCLLEDGRKGWIKLHDLISDAALSIASKTHTSLVIRNSKLLTTYSDDHFRGCKSITLFLDDETQELPERLICPTLDMLLILSKKNKSHHPEIPDAFFENSGELKVLDMSNLIITSLPSSIQFLSKLHTLCLDSVEIDDLAIIGKLKTLKVLTFHSSKISQIPKQIGELNDLRLLDLTDCYRLVIIEPNVLGSLTRLEELYLPMSFDKWDPEGSSHASLTELSNMSRLSTLSICVPNANSLANSIPFQQLVRYKIHVGEKWHWEDFGEERTLKLEFDSSNSKLILKEWLQTALKKTQDLYLRGWIGIENIVSKLSKEGFPELKHISIESCPSVKHIIHSNQRDPFPVLESLSLFGLINLQEVCTGDLPHNSFRNLKVIKIEACDELRNLFSFSFVKDLPLLEEVEVRDCAMIQEIITYADVERADCEGRVAEKIEMLKLHKLRLENLPNISSFCSKGRREIVEDDGTSPFELLDGRQVSLPCLESLTLCELPMLTKISHNGDPAKLHGLKSLELSKCSSLFYALDSNMLHQLRNLESLVIEDCESMETVFDKQKLTNHEAISNHSLQINLKLRKLPKLKKNMEYESSRNFICYRAKEA